MKTSTFIRSLTLPLAATALLLPSAITSCLAQLPTPIVSPAIPVNARWYKLSVKYIAPKDILITLHWTAPTNLPEGVFKIYALEGDSSLFIQATPDGFNAVKDALKTLEVEPPSVQIKVKYVRVPITDVQSSGIKFTTYAFPPTVPSDHYQTRRGFEPQNTIQSASGDKVAALQASLIKNNTSLIQLPMVSVYNNVSTQVNISRTDVVGITVIPHFQRNNTAIFEITPVVEYLPDTQQNGGVPTKQVTIKETVLSNEPIVLAGLDQDAQTELLIFITPTLPTAQKQADDSAKN